MLIQTKHFTIAEYHQMIELGILQPSDRIELIRGELLSMAAKGTKHVVCCSNLNRLLNKLVDQQAIIRCQDPVFLPPDSEPEPDFAIVRDRADDYLTGHPLPEDILLVIEIADSTLKYDRDIKGLLYAEAGIPHYWIFNLIDYHLEVYREPYRDAKGQGNYAQRQYLLPHQAIALPNIANSIIELNKVFPTISKL